LGRATKLSSRFSGQDKTYVGTLRIGTETDSQDSQGEIVRTSDFANVTPEQVRNVMQQFEGEQMQVPPMVSAVKHEGKRLYKIARKGQTVEREPRRIVIKYLKVGRIELPDIDFEVRCSKGTYVRTLCFDIGTKLGCGGYLLGLRRTASGNFSIADATVVDEIKTWEKDKLFEAVIPLAQLLPHLSP